MKIRIIALFLMLIPASATHSYYKSCWREENNQDSITSPFNYTYYINPSRYVGLPFRYRCGVSLTDQDIVDIEYELENINPITPITDSLIYFYRGTVTGRILKDFLENQLALIVGEALRLIAESHGAQTRRQKMSDFDTDGVL